MPGRDWQPLKGEEFPCAFGEGTGIARESKLPGWCAGVAVGKTVRRSEETEVRQASRVIMAARRQAVAGERARITGKRVRQPSALEQAVVEWEQEQEARARKAEEERLRISLPVETPPFFPQQVSLPAEGIEPRQGEKKRTATTVTGRVNMAGVCALARRLMAIERARALGRKPVDLRAWALEIEARRWAGGQQWR